MLIRDLRLRLEPRIRIVVTPYVPGLAAARVGVAAARIGPAWVAIVVVRMMRFAFIALALVVVVMLPLAFVTFASVMVMVLPLAFIAFASVMVMMLPLAFIAYASIMVMMLALMTMSLAATARHIHRRFLAAARFPFYFHDPSPFNIAQPLL